MHGVEVGQHQDTLALTPRRLALEDVAEAIDTRRALEHQPKVAELPLDLVDHDIDRLAIVTRAFDRYPFDDAVEHLLGIDLRFVLQFGHVIRLLTLDHNKDLMLRSERSERLEAWAADTVPVPHPSTRPVTPPLRLRLTTHTRSQ